MIRYQNRIMHSLDNIEIYYFFCPYSLFNPTTKYKVENSIHLLTINGTSGSFHLL